MSPAPDTSPAPASRFLEDTNWRLQRQFKHHQRDMGRRTVDNRAKPRFKHHQHRANALRLEKEAWMSIPTKRVRCNVADQLRHMSSSQLSRSGPRATSWPPTLTASEDLDEAIEGIATISLASSSPLSALKGRPNSRRREARHMTLFESARIFNESGQLLSHEQFNEMGSPFKIHGEGVPKRKLNRRVGRRKHENKRANHMDALHADEVVLELMCLLFSDMDVTHELNLLLLGSTPFDDIFHFDEDDIPADSKRKKDVLNIDLLQFQTTLMSMLFNSNASLQEIPARGTSAETLQEIYFKPQWIAHEMLATVKLDVLAQYDRFAVIHAIFRTIPKLRLSITAAAASTSLAIFQYQGLETVFCQNTGDLVTVMGIIAFLNAVMKVVERDAQYNPEVFGDNEKQIRDTVAELCSQIMRAVQLLVRSSRGDSGSSDSQRNQLEKYEDCSDSVEATAYGALGMLVNRIAVLSPMHGEEFLRWMLLKWPQRNVHLELSYVKFTAGLLSQFMQLGLVLPADVMRRVFTRIEACIQSMHFLVAQEACNMCRNFQLISVYLSRDHVVREKIASALHENTTSHWNERIRTISDECFDMLLDLA